jgi:hypothetical protein
MQSFNLEQQIRLLIKTLQMGLGYEQVPVVIDGDTATYTAPSGSFFYAVKAMNGDALIAEALDINGESVMNSFTIKDGDELKFPLSEITLSSGSAILYKGVTIDAFMK